MPEFIKRMLGFADKVEAHMKAEAELKTALDRVSALEKELAELKAASPDGDVEIKHKAALAAEADKLAAKEKELTDFRAQAAKDLEVAQNRANEVLASMGIDVSQLPPAGNPSANPAGRGQDPLADLRAQLKKATSPTEKYRLSMQIRELLAKQNKAAA